jgi:hypothetical protein
MHTLLPWKQSSILMLVSVLSCFLTVAAAQPPNLQPAQFPTSGFRIAGTVVDAIGGSPLTRARVTILDVRNPQNLQWTITSEDGHFAFQQVGAGKYSLRGAKRGFIAADYDQHEQFSTAIVTGSGLDTQHLVLRLTPAAVLSGKVLDESGDPVRRAMVSLYAEDRGTGVGRIQKMRSDFTDDQGLYDFTPLDTGTYFLSASATPWYAVHAPSSLQSGAGNTPGAVDQSLDVAYPVTYYKDATDADEASPIPIRGGDHLEADIHLSPVPALHLLFHVPDNGEHGFNMPVLQKPAFDGMESVPVSGGQMVSPGVFELMGVAAGRYTVRMPVSPPGEQEPKWSEVELDLTADGQELDASRGEPISTVKASVELLGEGTLPRQFALLLRNSKMRVVAWQEVNEKGEAEFQDVVPDKYEVLVRAREKSYSISHISFDGGQISGHILNVAPGSSLTVSVSLVGSATRVEGFAKRSGKAVPGAMVVLVPKDTEANRELFRRDQSDQDGSFSLQGVIPGSYTVCAIENGWELDWAKPAVIARYCEHGQRLVVADGTEGTRHVADAVEVQLR